MWICATWEDLTEWDAVCCVNLRVKAKLFEYGELYNHILVTFMTDVALWQSISGRRPSVYLEAGSLCPVLMVGPERTLISFCDMPVTAAYNSSSTASNVLTYIDNTYLWLYCFLLIFQLGKYQHILKVTDLFNPIFTWICVFSAIRHTSL